VLPLLQFLRRMVSLIKIRGVSGFGPYFDISTGLHALCVAESRLSTEGKFHSDVIFMLML